ncbi:MAG: potassium-transporting ATPase subunit C [Spirochaetaceae bacterium]|nr:potassium-transporting ATPase subunit C [Spirochaetaceae bacterium]
MRIPAIPARIFKSVRFLFVMTILLGIVYPAVVTGIAQLIFPDKANGSLIVLDGKVRGSSLLAQRFDSPQFFHPRPSATDYTYIGAGASNQGPISAALVKTVEDRQVTWERSYGSLAPEEMLYASGSGLDPDISVDAALAQVNTVAKARGLSDYSRRALVAAINEQARASKGLIGVVRINVMKLNTLLETDPEYRGTVTRQ